MTNARTAAVSLALAAAALASPTVGRAQTDYYNTDRGRPIRIEDAYTTERHAFDAHLAPIRLERSRGGIYTWELEPELAYGILPRTQLELGLPLAFTDLGDARRRVGLEGVELSVLHNLNAETRGIPALGFRATAIMPVGALAPERAFASLQGIATRTFRRARVHANVELTAGDADEADHGAERISRWLAGVAVDRPFPLRSLLVTAELFARRPVHDGSDVEWNAGTGVRYQLTPLFALDGGVGKRLTGDDRTWYVTFGVARVFALGALMPTR